MALRLAANVVLRLFKSIFLRKTRRRTGVIFGNEFWPKKLAFWTLLPNEPRYQVEIKS